MVLACVAAVAESLELITLVGGFLLFVVVDHLLHLGRRVCVFGLVWVLHPEEVLLVVGAEAEVVDPAWVTGEYRPWCLGRA